MSPFATVHALVLSLFEKHCPEGDTLFGGAAKAFQAERTSLLASHGWDAEEYTARVDEYVSDFDLSE